MHSVIDTWTYANSLIAVRHTDTQIGKFQKKGKKDGNQSIY